MAESAEVKVPPSVPPGSCVVVICNAEVMLFTVSVAAVLVALPTALLTTTVNCVPPSEITAAGVV